jgi:FMN reductase
MRSGIVVGNPKPRSRTFESANHLVDRLTGAAADVSVDLIDLGSELLDGSSELVADAVAELRTCDLLVVASPTYKASITGVLKLFLDRVEAGGFRGTTAVPLMLGGDLRHSLAPEVFLRPILVELGLICPAPGLFLLDSAHLASDRLGAWLATSADVVMTTATARHLWTEE